MEETDMVQTIPFAVDAKPANMLLLATLAAEVTARAVVNAIHAAQGLTIDGQRWPAAGDIENLSI